MDVVGLDVAGIVTVMPHGSARESFGEVARLDVAACDYVAVHGGRTYHVEVTTDGKVVGCRVVLVLAQESVVDGAVLVEVAGHVCISRADLLLAVADTVGNPQVCGVVISQSEAIECRHIGVAVPHPAAAGGIVLHDGAHLRAAHLCAHSLAQPLAARHSGHRFLA